MKKLWNDLREEYAKPMWLGWFAGICFTNFVQDWRGKEGTIAYIQENWVNTHWSMWIALVLILLYWGGKQHKKLQRKEQK